MQLGQNWFLLMNHNILRPRPWRSVCWIKKSIDCSPVASNKSFMYSREPTDTSTEKLPREDGDQNIGVRLCHELMH